MPKGLRMEHAYDPMRRAVRAAADASCHEQGFQCESCRTSVTHVSGYELRGDDKDLRRFVPPFFRLAQNEEHATGCRHTPMGQVEILVAEAKAVENAVNPFECRDGNRFIFRLNIPATEIRSLGQDNNRSLSKAEYRERVERVWTGRRIAAYCRSAIGLARLWCIMEGPDGRADLRDAVSIVDGGQEIGWNDFFFPPQRYDGLASRIERRDLHHPAAALVEAQAIEQDRNGRPYVKCVPAEAARTQLPTRVALSLFVPSALTDGFVPHGRYVVFGNWFEMRPNIWTSKDKAVSICYRNFGLRIFRRSQFCRIALPGEGE